MTADQSRRASTATGEQSRRASTATGEQSRRASTATGGQSLRTSVVVATMDRPGDLRECLLSLAGQTRPPEEVVVVDDGDRERTADVLAGVEVDSVVHVEGDGGGLPASRNRGVEEATGDVVCFVDDDVVLPPNWLAEILAVYRERDPDGVGGLVVNYNPEDVGKGDVTSLPYRIVTAVRYLFFHDRVGEVGPMGVLYAPLTLNTTGVKPVESLQGCNMTFRAEVFEERAFDEWYGVGGAATAEEVDFCTRVVRDGGSLVFTPRAVAVHKRSTAGGEGPDGGHHFRNFRNLALYSAKNSPRPALELTLLVVHALVWTLLARTLRPLRLVGEGLAEYRSRTPRESSRSGR